MHSLNTANSATRPSTGMTTTNATAKQSDENKKPNIIRKTPSAPALTTAAKTPLVRARITATATRSTTLRPSQSRTPLRPKDRNAVATTPGAAAAATRNSTPSPGPPRPHPPFTTQRAMKTTTSSSTRMPPTNTARQPQLPTLAKPINRTPLTPKIASGKANTASTAAATAPASTPTPRQPQHHQRTVIHATTPLPRRTARPESALSNQDTPHREDLASPVSAFFAHSNITPRSGKRQSRLDSNSANSTPSGTPQPEVIEAWDNSARSGAGNGDQLGYGLDGGGGSEWTARRQAVTFSPVVPQHSNNSSSSVDSKFFYASDAVGSSKSPQPQPQPQALPTRAFAAPPLQKASTFCYANGASIPPNPSSGSGGSVVGSSSPMVAPSAFSPALLSQQSSKFVYANGTPDLLPSQMAFSPPSRPASTMSAASRITTNRNITVATPPSAGFPVQRPVSPLKQPSYIASKPPSLVGGRIAATPSLAHAMPGAGNPLLTRKASNDITPPTIRPGHSRAGSLTMADPATMARVLSSHPSSQDSSPTIASMGASSSVLGFAAILQAADDLDGAADDDEDGEVGDDDLQGEDGMRSPTKPNDPIDELVINARRERKVQDLEITNASLEAINRTLERQLRKQTAELRRYRRLSRSGRLSLASMATSTRTGSRVVSDATVEGPLRDPRVGLDALSEEEDEDEDDEDDDSFDHDSDSSEYAGSGGSTSSHQLSPSTMAARDARHRQRDEKRLRLDLSKHQQLLVDSQKINQSLKRCLGWTEELIREGRRALEYQVRVSEVEIGGHVLVQPDDDEEEDDADARGPHRRDADEMRAVVVDFGHGDGDIEGDADGDEEPTVSLGLPDHGSGKTLQAGDRDSGVDLPGDGG